MLHNYSERYETPDEELGYSELRDRIRNEVTSALPKKERLVLLAKKLEDNLTIRDTICDRICTDFKGVITEQYIRRCLPREYKQQSKKREKSNCDLRNNGFANEGRNVLEQSTMIDDGCGGNGGPDHDITVKTHYHTTKTEMIREIIRLREENSTLMKDKGDAARKIDELKKQLAKKTEQASELTKEIESLKSLLEQKKDGQQQKIASGAQEKVEGKETTFKDTGGPNIRSDFEEEKRLHKHLTDATEERDSPNNEYENLKEETKLELFQKFQEKFYNGPGILDAKDLQKISMEAGKDLETKYFERYGNIIQEAVELGQPVPAGTYIMTKPTMKLVPVRINVDFDKREIECSLWEKKLEKL